MIAGANVAGTIQGIDGASYAVDKLSFDQDSYHFAYGDAQTDVTNNLKRADKLLLVPDFDIARENYRLSQELGAGGNPSQQALPDSTAAIFANQIINDPLAAPLESLNNTVDKLVASPGLRKLALLGFIGLAIYFVTREK